LLVLHGHEPVWKASHLPERLLRADAAAPSVRPRSVRAPTADEAAFEAFVESLRTHQGNVSRAASALGITRARAYRLLEARPEFDIVGLRGDQPDGN
jgi:transcriptional regulator of acetoin/glycerol metabolism